MCILTRSIEGARSERIFLIDLLACSLCEDLRSIMTPSAEAVFRLEEIKGRRMKPVCPPTVDPSFESLYPPVLHVFV